MVIKKDPDELPDQVVNFNEVFSDINTPEYWIAETEEDLEPTMLVLDGHSTILTYKQVTEELHWEAHHELGQYKYIPDMIGDGIIIFPHSFYFEFKIYLTDKEIEVNASFDGTGVRAIVMPLNDVRIDEFFEVLEQRLSSIFSSVLKPNDDQLSIAEGEVMTIPTSVESNLSYKLALLGINLQKIKVDTVKELEVEEGEMVEEVFEAPTPQPQEEAHEEKRARKPVPKEKRKIPPPKQSRSKTEPTDQNIPSPGKSTSAPPPTPGKSISSGPPSPGAKKETPSSSSQAPPRTPTSTGKESAATPSPEGAVPTRPPSPEKGATVEVDAEEKEPSSIPPPPGGGSKSSEETKPAPPPVQTSATDHEKEVADEAEAVEEEETDTQQPNLYARGMDISDEKPVSLRHTHATWFEKMIPNRAYPVVIKISSEKMKASKSVTNQKTGEKRSETTDKLVVDERNLLTVRPEFPGSIVVPTQQTVDARQEMIELTFHVTPLALGTLDARIVFEQNGKRIHDMQLKTKVIKHRIARWSAALGAFAGVIPALIAFFTGQTPSAFMNERFADVNLTAFASFGYAIPAIISVLLFGIAGGTYYLQQPSRTDKSVPFPR